MVEIKSIDDINRIRVAGRILAKAFKKIRPKIKSGINTQELDNLVKSYVEADGATCAFLGYRSYPANSCISINEEVVHGIPSSGKIIRDGDIVSIDIGVKLDGYFADSAITVAVGKVDRRIKKLIDVTKKALELGIKQAKVGNFLSNVSYAVQRHAESNGFSVVRDFAGHGIGKNIHEDPEIPNFGMPDSGILIKEGMVLAIEPMINIGDWQVEIAQDGWTVVTKDKLPSAHFEHTVAILDGGPEILT